MGTKEDCLRHEVPEQACVFMRTNQYRGVIGDTKKKVEVSSGLRRSVGGNAAFCQASGSMHLLASSLFVCLYFFM